MDVDQRDESSWGSVRVRDVQVSTLYLYYTLAKSFRTESITMDVPAMQGGSELVLLTLPTVEVFQVSLLYLMVFRLAWH